MASGGASGRQRDSAQLSVPPWSPDRAGSTTSSDCTLFAHPRSEAEDGGCHEDVPSTNVPPGGEALQAEHLLLLQLAEGRSAQHPLPALSCPCLPRGQGLALGSDHNMLWFSGRTLNLQTRTRQ